MTAQETALARFCGECGTALASPGQRCGACGTAPAAMPAVRQVTAEAALLGALGAGDHAALEELLATPDGEAAANVIRLRAAGIRSQQEASAYFLAADQAAYEGALAKAAHDAGTALGRAEEEASRLAGLLKTATGAERAAQDRAADAAENLRKAAEAEERARLDKAGPDEQTEALMRMTAAETVAGRERAAAGTATAAREQAERALAAARATVSTARQALAAAKDRAANPGTALRSEYTLVIDVQRSLLSGTLTEGERALASAVIHTLAELSGAARSFVGDGKRQAREEIAEAARTHPWVVPHGDGTATGIMPISQSNPWSPGR